MQVALVTGQHRLELVDMPEPTPEPGKAVVDIAYCGICGTDLHAYASGDPYNPSICGHEWMGQVSALGKGVTHVREGDRVAIGIASACGNCRACRRGNSAHCETALLGAMGMGPMATPHGGFARAISMDAQRIYRVRDDLSDPEAAMLEPLAVAVHALRRTGPMLGDRTLILGAGPVGCLVLQCARAAGVGPIVVVDPHEARRALALRLGADHVLDADPETLPQRLEDLFQGGADLVFECAGVADTIDQSVQLVRRGGKVSLVGVPSSHVQINAPNWIIKEIHLVTSLAYQYEEFEIAQGLVQDGRVRLESLHTRTVGLADLDSCFVDLLDSPADMKVLVDPRL